MSESARKPFNLQEALAGKPVVTRDGRKVLSITQLPTLTTTRYTLFAHIDGDDYGKGFTADGLYIAGVTSSDDLFMAPVEKTFWANIYPDGYGGNSHQTYFLHDSQGDADRVWGIQTPIPRLGNKAHKITWIED